ncbi:cytochrome c oxidase subunit 7C, mitochondrial-like [Ischnura elegans]|uniref:cytochrome c oxidase subunit 7C, mitochondrial-like n=1 Tax=Ischnura elegans TaxID=197161 RepID=UPI001ED869FF|nr:cytochrome c oxidase subunit 7C, mitochondrial-like [Ischnura elegans]
MSLVRTAMFARNFMTSAARKSYYNGGIPGENLPFSINNRHKLLAMFMVYFGSGFALPFLVVRYQLLKK